MNSVSLLGVLAVGLILSFVCPRSMWQICFSMWVSSFVIYMNEILCSSHHELECLFLQPCFLCYLLFSYDKKYKILFTSSNMFFFSVSTSYQLYFSLFSIKVLTCILILSFFVIFTENNNLKSTNCSLKRNSQYLLLHCRDQFFTMRKIISVLGNIC